MAFGPQNQQIHWQNGKLNVAAQLFQSRTSIVAAPFMERPMEGVVQGVARSTWVDNTWARFTGGSGALPDGEIIAVKASYFLAASEQHTACVLVRLRQGAALLRISLKHPRGPRSNYEPVVAFLGFADILSAEEAEHYGVTVPDSMVEVMSDSIAIAELFEIEELKEADTQLGAVEEVVTEGGVITVQSHEPIRRLRFRKRSK